MYISRRGWPSGLQCLVVHRAQCFGKLILHLLLLVPCLAYSSTLKMEVICCSKILSSLQITQHCKPEDRTLHSQCHEKPKYNLYFTLVPPFIFAPVDMGTLLTFRNTGCGSITSFFQNLIKPIV
jgi:hypothetical protein